MEKNQKKLIFFMPSMEGGGVEKNLIIVANYVSKYIDCVNLITFDDTQKKGIAVEEMKKLSEQILLELQ